MQHPPNLTVNDPERVAAQKMELAEGEVAETLKIPLGTATSRLHRTLWAGPVPDNDSWRVGGNKVIWIRPQGTQLTIDGRRLDADASPLKTWIPDGYTTGFQVLAQRENDDG